MMNYFREQPSPHEGRKKRSSEGSTVEQPTDEYHKQKKDTASAVRGALSEINGAIADSEAWVASHKLRPDRQFKRFVRSYSTDWNQLDSSQHNTILAGLLNYDSAMRIDPAHAPTPTYPIQQKIASWIIAMKHDGILPLEMPLRQGGNGMVELAQHLCPDAISHYLAHTYHVTARIKDIAVTAMAEKKKDAKKSPEQCIVSAIQLLSTANEWEEYQKRKHDLFEEDYTSAEKMLLAHIEHESDVASIELRLRDNPYRRALVPELTLYVGHQAFNVNNRLIRVCHSFIEAEKIGPYSPLGLAEQQRLFDVFSEFEAKDPEGFHFSLAQYEYDKYSLLKAICPDIYWNESISHTEDIVKEPEAALTAVPDESHAETTEESVDEVTKQEEQHVEPNPLPESEELQVKSNVPVVIATPKTKQKTQPQRGFFSWISRFAKKFQRWWSPTS